MNRDAMYVASGVLHLVCCNVSGMLQRIWYVAMYVVSGVSFLHGL